MGGGIVTGSTLIDLTEPSPHRASGIIRLRTSYWSDRRGLYRRQSLTYLKRRSVNGCWIEEDVENVGAEEIFPRILNMDDCQDGLYEIVPCNESHDYETGHIDDYDYRLIPYGSVELA